MNARTTDETRKQQLEAARREEGARRPANVCPLCGSWKVGKAKLCELCRKAIPQFTSLITVEPVEPADPVRSMFEAIIGASRGTIS